MKTTNKTQTQRCATAQEIVSCITDMYCNELITSRKWLAHNLRQRLNLSPTVAFMAIDRMKNTTLLNVTR